MTMTKAGVPPRSEIAKEYTWNAESVFETREDWDAACDEVVELLPEVQQYQGRLAEGASVLADYLEIADQVVRIIGKVFVYASMSSAVDSNDQQATAMSGKARGLFGRVMAATAFSDPELLEIGKEKLSKMIQDDPRLPIFEHYIDNLFRTKAYVRSAEVEEIMGMVADPFGSIFSLYGALTSADMQFDPAVDSDGNEIPLAQSNVDKLKVSPDRELRRTAWESYADSYLALKNTHAATLTMSIKQDVFRSRVRGYDSTLQASLFANNIPVEVFQNLIDTYQKNIPTWHKYWRVRREALGYDELHPYDIWAPIVQNEAAVSYQQAVDWICEGMKPLGDDYVDTMRRGCLEDRWVDVFPNQGKRSGAFSSGVHDTFPFIMMSFNDTLGSMSTLAHELGHSMHSYLSRKNQPSLYSGYTLFVAEVASNFNQAMTRAHLMKTNTDKNFQIALIQEAMDNFHRYFFIMPTLARFEMEMHARIEKGAGVTADDMIGLMTELFAEGYGDEMAIDHDRVGITWAQFGHLYANFYVYQYATGISAAHALADKILAGDETAAKQYVEFLSLGGSVYPLDALNHAGVDMLSPEAVETTFGVLASYVDRLEELINS